MPKITQENQYGGDTTATIYNQKTLYLVPSRLSCRVHCYCHMATIPLLLWSQEFKMLSNTKAERVPPHSPCNYWVGTTNWWNLGHVLAHCLQGSQSELTCGTFNLCRTLGTVYLNVYIFSMQKKEVEFCTTINNDQCLLQLQYSKWRITVKACLVAIWKQRILIKQLVRLFA